MDSPTLKREVGLGLPQAGRVALALGAAGAVFLAARLVAGAAGRPATVAGVAVLSFGLVLAGLWGAKALAFVAALLGVAGYANLNVVTNMLPVGPQPQGALVRCPSAKLDTGWAGEVDQQVGTTGAFAHRGASTYSARTRRYPKGCVLDFDGYCVGTAERDLRSQAPNTVWFRRGHEFVAAADVTPILMHRTADGFSKRDCTGGSHPPVTPAFMQDRQHGNIVTLAAVAPFAEIVGFAAYYDNLPGRDGTGSWHRLGVDANASGGFHVRWDTLSALGVDEARATRVTVMAVPCLALDFPQSVQTTHAYDVSRTGTVPAPTVSDAGVTPRTFTAASRIAGRRAACRDPMA